MIDAHHHFWWLAKWRHHWPDAAGGRLDRDFTAADLRPELERCGIAGSVLVQVAQHTDETAEFLKVARAHPFVRGVVGWVPLADPDACARALKSLGDPKLVGVRPLMAYEPDPAWLLQDRVMESLRLVSAAGLAFDAIPINTAQLKSVVELGRRLPDLRIVVNHLGRPPIPEHGWEPWASLAAAGADLPNMTMKLSIGLDIIMRWKWATEDVRRYADFVLERFGPARVMAASNWPVILLGGSYAEVWAGLTDLVRGLPAAERQMVLGGTAERVYLLPRQ
jgi:L-fuconolactonase